MHQKKPVLSRLTVFALLASGIAGCSGDSGNLPPGQPDFSDSDVLLFIGARTLLLQWEQVAGATHYKVFENPDGSSGFTQLQPTIPVGGISQPEMTDDLEVTFDAPNYSAAFRISVHLQDWDNARYRVESCSSDDVCTLIGAQGAPGFSGLAIQNIRPTGAGSSFGFSFGLTEDGATLAGGAPGESTIAYYKGVDPATTCDEDGNPLLLVPVVDEMGDPVLDDDGLQLVDIFDEDDNLLDPETVVEQCPISEGSGTVLTYDLNADELGIEAYIKAPNADEGDNFGYALDISEDGNVLVVSAVGEDSNSIDTRGNDDADSAGAAYVFRRDSEGVWPLPGEQADYLKASNPEAEDLFGWDVAISGDGTRIAVSTVFEDSAATGINGDEGSNDAENSGAVYVFSQFFGNWIQEAYIKASNTDAEDFFGSSLAFNHAGDLLVVGAPGESSADATDQADNSKLGAGAVYVFTRDGSDWNQTAFVKASNADAAQQGGDLSGDLFGASVSVNEDGSLLLVGAPGEDSIAMGVDGNESDNSIRNSGAAYLFGRDGNDWNKEAYFKASNTGQLDEFGSAVALSASGNSLAIAAPRESSSAVGVNGTENIDNVVDSGAVYYFENEMSVWLQKAFVKASTPGFGIRFGQKVRLGQDGEVLIGSAPFEDSFGTDSGAIFVY